MDGAFAARKAQASGARAARRACVLLACALALSAAPAAAQTGFAPEATAEASPSLAAPGIDPRPAPTPAADPALPRDLSPLGMFRAADAVVRAVLIGLALASVLTWAAGFVKALEVAGARRRVRRALRVVAAAPSLDAAARALRGQRGAAAAIVGAAVAEAAQSAGALAAAGGEGLKERTVSRVSRIEAASARRMARGTGLLATIGATAPFVGLFGTVWGIMNAFIGISEAQTTNLAVVAPGIAEALLATALGLVAAIPAVVLYNHFARSIAFYRLLLGDVSAATLRLVSRDIDFGHLPPGEARAPEDWARGAGPARQAAE